MKLPHKKSRTQRLAEAINPFKRSRKTKFDLPNVSVSDVSQYKVVRTGLIAGGLAGLTAASAGISARRRTARTKSAS